MGSQRRAAPTTRLAATLLLRPVESSGLGYVDLDRKGNGAPRRIQLLGKLSHQGHTLGVVHNILTTKQGNQLDEDVPQFVIGAIRRVGLQMEGRRNLITLFSLLQLGQPRSQEKELVRVSRREQQTHAHPNLRIINLRLGLE